jgi:hypothetical protein
LEDNLELNLLHLLQLMLDIIIKEVGSTLDAVGAVSPAPGCAPIVGYEEENEMLSMARMYDTPLIVVVFVVPRY